MQTACTRSGGVKTRFRCQPSKAAPPKSAALNPLLAGMSGGTGPKTKHAAASGGMQPLDEPHRSGRWGLQSEPTMVVMTKQFLGESVRIALALEPGSENCHS